MVTLVLVIHLLLAIALIAIVLVQQSEGGALGIGGGGGMSGFMSGRSTANLVTRTTAVLGAAFFATSITLAVLGGRHRESNSVVDLPASAPVQTPAKSPAKSPAKPAPPPGPSVPLAK